MLDFPGWSKLLWLRVKSTCLNLADYWSHSLPCGVRGTGPCKIWRKLHGFHTTSVYGFYSNAAERGIRPDLPGPCALRCRALGRPPPRGLACTVSSTRRSTTDLKAPTAPLLNLRDRFNKDFPTGPFPVLSRELGPLW